MGNVKLDTGYWGHSWHGCKCPSEAAPELHHGTAGARTGEGETTLIVVTQRSDAQAPTACMSAGCAGRGCTVASSNAAAPHPLTLLCSAAKKVANCVAQLGEGLLDVVLPVWRKRAQQRVGHARPGLQTGWQAGSFRGEAGRHCERTTYEHGGEGESGPCWARARSNMGTGNNSCGGGGSHGCLLLPAPVSSCRSGSAACCRPSSVACSSCSWTPGCSCSTWAACCPTCCVGGRRTWCWATETVRQV